MHKFKIHLTPAGAGSSVEMDGIKLSVSHISINAGVDVQTTVILELPSVEVGIEEAEIEAKEFDLRGVKE